MKKVVMSVVAALAVAASAAPAFAGDMAVKSKSKAPPPPPPSPWDVAFGSALMSDYVFRGVTQSGHNPSVAAYFEARYNINPDWQLYAGVSGESIKFANNAAAEVDFYGGVRPTFGPLALDIGIWEYYYPGGTCWGSGALQAQGVGGTGGTRSCFTPQWASGNVAKDDASFYEVYVKATYTMGDWAFGPTFFYSPNFLNTGADGEYLSGIIKYTAPAAMALGPLGWYASGEFGHQWLGTSDAFYGVLTPAGALGAFSAGIPEPDYNTWNVGLGFTWKVFTLDLRYSDTDLSKKECSAFTSDPGATVGHTPIAINPVGSESSWCGATFIAKLSADLTLGSLK